LAVLMDGFRNARILPGCFRLQKISKITL
jgi:hypothetical protein